MRAHGVFAMASVLALSAPAGGGVALRPTDGGVSISAGDMGAFTLTYPRITVGGKEEGPSEKRTEGAKAELRYPSGARLTATAGPDGLEFAFRDAPQGLNRYSVDMLINFNYRSGSWTIDGTTKGFPQEKPEKPFLYQGNATEFTLRNFEGKALSFRVPDYTYQQLQDNREWGWQIFAWKCFVPFDRNRPTHAFRIGQDLSKARRVVLVDRLGQNAQKDFPGKLGDEKELESDREAEKAYYGSFERPRLDRYGGLVGSRRAHGLRRTGYFHVERKGERWVLVDPDGNAFFQLGICCLGPGEDYTYTEGREQVFEWLPERTGRFAPAWHPERWWSDKAASFYIANVIRKFGSWDAEANVLRMIDRARAFGFNSSGAWSYVSEGTKAERWPYTPSLPLGRWSLDREMIPGVREVLDPFDDEVRRAVDEKFARQVGPNAEDPLIIGYFLSNEQGFEDIPRAIPALDGKHACKRRLVEMLRDKYGTVAAFNGAWETAEQSFGGMANAGLPVKTRAAFDDMHAYMELFLEEYFGLVHDTFRKYDSNHMLIGNRWQPGTANSEVLCRVAGKHLDAISVNYYTHGIDSAFVKRVYDACGRKPMFWSEFHFGCGAESGLPGRMDVETQAARGLGYRHYVEGAAALGYVVGIQWFTLIDQPITGRFFEKYTGENFNIGIFSVADRPYRPMVEEMAKTNARVYDVWLGGERPFVFDHPLFSPKGQARRAAEVRRVERPMKIDGLLDGWPNMPAERIGADRLVIGAGAKGLEASFKLCYDEGALYVLVQVVDPTPMRNARTGGDIWNGDGIELFVGHEEPDRAGALLPSDRQVLLSAGVVDGRTHAYVPNVHAQEPIGLAVVPSVDGKGYTLEAAVPWKALGFAPRGGREIMFDIAVDDAEAADGGRLRQLMWNGGARNSTDRTAWGRATLAR